MSRSAYLRSVYQSILDRLPTRFASHLDRYLGPGGSTVRIGALNGQLRRREIFEDLVQRLRFARLIETGTYLGTSTRYFAGLVPSVLSVEIAARNFESARTALKGHANVELTLGDSRIFLRRMAQNPSMKLGPTFFYLDAHWHWDLPLAEELRIISGGWTDAVAMVDDFEVPGEPGYGFDDYGPRMRLTEAILPGEALAGWQLFYPAAPARAETGAKRGCVFLASPSLVDHVEACPLLLRTRHMIPPVVI